MFNMMMMCVDYYKGKSQGKGKGKSQFNLAGQVVRILIFRPLCVSI